MRETLMMLRPGARSLVETAQRSRICMEDLRQRLDLLENEGYVRKVRGEGSSPCPSPSRQRCRGCRSRSCCDDQGVTFYFLTEKGSRVLDRG